MRKREKRKKKETARRLEASWDLLRPSLELIEENETWSIASRMERQYNQERRMEMWEQDMSAGD